MDIKKKLTTGSLHSRLAEALLFIGYRYTENTITENLVRWVNIFPFVIKHFHCLSMGAGGLGKGYVPSELFERQKLVLSLTMANIFGSATGDNGLLSELIDVLLFDEISNFRNKNIEDIEAPLKTYMGETPVIRSEYKKPYNNDPSLMFIANTDDNYQELLNKSPYNYSNILYQELPSFFHDFAVKERLINLPFWLCSPLEKSYLSNEYEPHRKNFIDYIAQLRQENLPINVSEGNIRNQKKYQKIITGFLVTLYDETYGERDLEELEAFAKFIVELSAGKYKEFYSTQAGKRFALKLALGYLPQDINIERVFFDKNRVLVKEQGQPFYTKIALNKYGIQDSRKELELFEKNKRNTHIAEIISLSQNGIIMKQEYFALGGRFSELRDLSFLSKNSPDSELKNLKKLIESQKREMEEIKLYASSIANAHNDLIKYLIDTSNGVYNKLPEFLETKMKEDIDKNKDNFKKLIAKTLNIPKDNIRNYHIGINENGEFKLVNFGRLLA